MRVTFIHMAEIFQRTTRSFLVIWLLIPLGFAEQYKILSDRSIGPSLPKRWTFENLTNKLFRNADGTILYLGPGEKGEYFIIRSETDIREIKAPSTGKAYMNDEGEFAIWYDRLDQGITFKNGHKIKFKNPVKSRFGVSYGAEYFYVYEDQVSRVYKTEDPGVTLLTLRDFYLYKVAARKNGELILFGFRAEGVRQIRKHVIVRWEKLGEEWQAIQTLEVPRYYQVMDVDTAHPRVLLLNEAQLAPQVFDWDLNADRIQPIGTVDSFAIYMNKDFTIGEDMISPTFRINQER